MRTTRVKIEGQTYDIPDMWLIGAERTLGSIQAAVQCWHEQAQMEAEFNRQRQEAA